MQVKHDFARSPRWSAGGFVTATQALSATELDHLTPFGLRRRVKLTISESFVAGLKCELLYGYRFTSREAARIVIFDYIEGFYDQVRRHSSLCY